MSDNKGLIKILWDNISGETQKQIEALSWKAIVTFLADETGKAVLTSVLPGGPILVPILFPIASTVGRVTLDSLNDWGKMKWNDWGKVKWEDWDKVKWKYWGEMNMHINDSGIAVLEKPAPLIASTKHSNLRETIEIPLTELIKPSDSLRLHPKVRSQGRKAYSSRQGYALMQLHLKLERQQRNTFRHSPADLLDWRKLRENSERSCSTIEEDIFYPEWVYTGKLPKPGESIRLVSVSDFRNRDRARRSETIRKKNNIRAAAAAQRNLHIRIERIHNRGEEAIRRSRDHADRVRRHQERSRHEADRRRRNRQNNPHHKR